MMYKTGHSLIKAKMAEIGAPLSGEMSGHIFYKDGFYGHDDALYVAVRLLDILARGEATMAELKDAMPATHSTPEVRFDCPEERKFQAIAEIRANLAAEAARQRHRRRARANIGRRRPAPRTSRRCWWSEPGTPEGLELKAEIRRQLDRVGIAAPAP